MARRNKKKRAVPAIGAPGMPRATYAEMQSEQQNASVGRGHVPAVREAADSTDERVCAHLVVPARGGDMSPPYKGLHDNDRESPPYVIARSAATWQSIFILVRNR